GYHANGCHIHGLSGLRTLLIQPISIVSVGDPIAGDSGERHTVPVNWRKEVFMSRITVKAKKNPAAFKRILVAVDGSLQSEWAVEKGAALAKALGAKLALVHTFLVFPGPQETATPYAMLEGERRKVANQLLERHQSR